ncbi:zinc finger protein [Gracilaria domingensis]|nr:zinc finger protein [Gracilaria domingensis]
MIPVASTTQMTSAPLTTPTPPAVLSSNVPPRSELSTRRPVNHASDISGMHLSPPIAISRIRNDSLRQEGVVSGSPLPDMRHEGRLPSVRSIVSGVDMSNMVPRTEPQGSYWAPSRASLTLPQHYPSRPNYGYDQQPTVSVHGYVAGGHGNPSVYHQSQGHGANQYNSYCQRPGNVDMPVMPNRIPQPRQAHSGCGYRGDHAAQHQNTMQRSMVPYSLGSSMQAADSRTPAFQVGYQPMPTMQHGSLEEVSGLQVSQSLVVTASAQHRPITDPVGPTNGALRMDPGASYQQRVQGSENAGYPSAPYYYGHVPQSSQQAYPVTDEIQTNVGQNWRYVVPGSAGAEELSEAFLSKITARAYMDGENNIRCSECEEEYGNIPSWKRHASRAHRKSKTPKVKCEICDIEVQNEGNLKRHMKTVHKTVPNPFICSHCPAMFSSDRARSIHVMKIHTVPVEEDLSVDGGVAKRRGRRGRAGTKAAKPKIHRCPHCAYVSSWRGNISRHVNAVHLELRQFPCDKCDRRFNTASNLSVHQMTHMRETENGG